jgi:hypothetical protein
VYESGINKPPELFDKRFFTWFALPNGRLDTDGGSA